MKKVKVFFVAGAMLLVTAGVFAGKASHLFASVTNLYYNDGGGTTNAHFHVVASSITTPILVDNNAGGTLNQAFLQDQTSSISYALYELSGTTYKPVYNSAF